MSQEVYLVGAGQFSGYAIHAVFLDRAEADAYCDKLKLVDATAGVEVRLTGAPQRHVTPRPFWTASIDIVTGDMDNESYDMTTQDAPKYEWFEESHHSPHARGWYQNGYPSQHSGWMPRRFQAVSFVSQDHANKVAVECRQFYLRRIDLSKGEITESAINYPVELCALLPYYESGDFFNEVFE